MTGARAWQGGEEEWPGRRDGPVGAVLQGTDAASHLARCAEPWPVHWQT